MRKLKKASCLLLAVLLVFSLGGFAVFDAHAVVLDPVAWLYPIWQMYGAQAGVTVSTMGGDAFTQQGFTSLFDEWQQSEVASGLSSAVQTIGQFVESVREFVDIGAGATFGGTLWSALRLASGITSKLARFWNWIIVDKLGGSSFDSVDFHQSNGNLVYDTGLPALPVLSDASDVISQGLYLGRIGDRDVLAGALDGSAPYYPFIAENLLFFCSDHEFAQRVVVAYRTGSVLQYFNGPYHDASYPNVFYCGWNGLFTGLSPSSNVTSFTGLEEGLSYFDSVFGGGISVSTGAITVTADPGVDVLGFPDADDPAYIPSDAVIPWNIPYDQTKDTNGYLDEAYEKALDNDLTDQPDISNPPVEGSGTVEDVGAYVVPGLGDVFPFCIPFDIYDFLSALASDPVAPHFTANLEFPAPIGTQTIDLDFDTPTFNQLAQLLRLLELLAFIVGLAFITRSMIIRG